MNDIIDWKEEYKRASSDAMLTKVNRILDQHSFGRAMQAMAAEIMVLNWELATAGKG